MENKEMILPLVLREIVSADLCIGCGLCVYSCPADALKMHWNEYGFLVPVLQGDCDNNGLCIKSCPFNNQPENDISSEDDIASFYLKEAKNKNSRFGRYNGIYAGYSNQFRNSSSSGGLATYIIIELFERGLIDHIISVTESKEQSIHYEYSILSCKSDVLLASKTKYYPVTLDVALKKIQEVDGKVAVVGVGCFIKAIRIAQHHDVFFKEKISFLIGIICGGIKSSFFTDYLAQKTGVLDKKFIVPEYRIKNSKSSAIDYKFGCTKLVDNKLVQLRMQTLGDMWGTGLFKANACDFCDDVTTELADISLGDAWLEPYSKDGAGNNVIVTRSKIADDIIKAGILDGSLNVEVLDLNRFIASQQGSFNHRHRGLFFRIKVKGKYLLRKRERLYERISLSFKLVQLLRMYIRKRSLKVWLKESNAIRFDERMKFSLSILRRTTRLYHFVERINNITLKKVLSKISDLVK